MEKEAGEEIVGLLSITYGKALIFEFQDSGARILTKEGSITKGAGRTIIVCECVNKNEIVVK